MFVAQAVHTDPAESGSSGESRAPGQRCRGPPTSPSGCCLRAYTRRAEPLWEALGTRSGGCHYRRAGLTTPPALPRRTRPAGTPRRPRTSACKRWTCGLATFSKLRAPESRRQTGSRRSRSGRQRGAGTRECKGSGSERWAPAGRPPRRAVTAAGCTVSSPEIAILIKGWETRGTFISPDAQLSEQGKGQEGAPKNRAGAGGVGELVRGCWGRWGTHLQSRLSLGRGLHRGWRGWAMEPSFHSQSLKRFSAQSRWPGWADPLLRQHPSSFATMMSFFHLSLPRPRHAGSRGPSRGTRAQPSPVTPITPTAHPRPAPARGWGRLRSRADRLALTLTSRSCGRRPILGLARSPSRTPGSLGHPRGAGRRWRAGAAARAGRPGSRVAARLRGARLSSPQPRSPARPRGLPLYPAGASLAAVS